MMVWVTITMLASRDAEQGDEATSDATLTTPPVPNAPDIHHEHDHSSWEVSGLAARAPRTPARPN